MKNTIFETELKVLDILWNEGDMTAKDLSRKLKVSTDWSRSTSYTIIRRCVEKGLIAKLGPCYTCRALITRETAQKQEVDLLTDKMFNGSSDLLVASLLGNNELTAAQIGKLRSMAEAFSA